MEEMSKKTKRLEKENLNLTRKQEATNKNIFQMAEERSQSQQTIDRLARENDKLKKLCRAMQTGGYGVAGAAGGHHADGGAEFDEGLEGETESEYEDEEYDEDDDGEYDDDTEEEGIDLRHPPPQQQQPQPKTFGPPPPPLNQVPQQQQGHLGMHTNGSVAVPQVNGQQSQQQQQVNGVRH
jgi:hypothetical protein